MRGRTEILEQIVNTMTTANRAGVTAEGELRFGARDDAKMRMTTVVAIRTTTAAAEDVKE